MRDSTLSIIGKLVCCIGTLCVLSLVASITHAEDKNTDADEQVIYKVKQADGTYTFVSYYVAGAEKLVLKRASSASITPLVNPIVTPKAKNQTYAPSTMPIYQVKIDSPADQATIRTNQQQVALMLSSSPAAPDNATWTIFVNDQVVTQSQQNHIMLSPIYRGQHTIKAQLNDQSGKILAVTNQITIFVHQTSAN